MVSILAPTNQGSDKNVPGVLPVPCNAFGASLTPSHPAALRRRASNWLAIVDPAVRGIEEEEAVLARFAVGGSAPADLLRGEGEVVNVCSCRVGASILPTFSPSSKIRSRPLH